MRSRAKTLRQRWRWAPGIGAAAALLVTGCTGVPTTSERQSRADLKALRQVYRPGVSPPTLPTLDTNATLGTFLTYAMLNQPRVAAAYYEYAAAVERITVERSLPDPRLTLELDIQEIVTQVMPGLMTDLPWLNRLRTRADAAAAESEARYFRFETAVLQTAFDVKQACYQLFSLNERLRVNREMLALLEQTGQLAPKSRPAKPRCKTSSGRRSSRSGLGTEILNLG